MEQILIIDDDNEFRNVLKEMLERKNYKVMTASNGEEGLRAYHENPAPIIITDIIMPSKNGVEIIFELVAQYPDISIIAISGGGKIDAEEYSKIIESIPNVKCFIKKPFAREELLTAIQKILRSK